MYTGAAIDKITGPGKPGAILRDFEFPRIAWLSKNLIAACFPLMKLIPARFMIETAADNGSLQRGTRVIESTSGTFGLALAMVCSSRPYELTIVTDPAVDSRLHARMEQMGAQVEVVVHKEGKLGHQGARLSRLRELMDKNPAAYWPNQYANPLNPQAYGHVADYLIERIGQFEVLVGPVGTGGSMTGMARRLQELGSPTKIVAIDTCNSVLFGQENGPRILRGLGNSILPPNLDHRLFDYVSWVPYADAFAATRNLNGNYGLFMGPTSGASFKVAQWWAARQPESRIVFICPDDGNRYASTLYDDDWYSRLVCGQTASADPVVVASPAQEQGSWSLMRWARRSWEDVTGQSAQELSI